MNPILSTLSSASRPGVLSVRDLSKTFVLHLRDGLRLPVLQAVSLDVQAGECVALVGRSGQGKSTLMRCLHGSYGADCGQAWLRRTAVGAGENPAPIDLLRCEPRQILALRRREIAYVSQFLRAVPRVSALDVVAERVLDADPGTGRRSEAELAQALDAARERVRTLFARLNLPPSLWSLPPATFSGGEQQRVNIARGFIEPATLLLLDEPTASLDAANRAVVIGLIQEAKAAGAAVLGIFHDAEVRDAVADRCINMIENRAMALEAF